MSFVILGIFVGFISGFFGVGGGMILTPILLYMGLSFKYAVGISVIQMVFSSVFGSFLNFKKVEKNSLKPALILACSGAVGAYFSGFIVSNLSEKTLSLIFLSIVILSIIKNTITPSTKVGQKKENNIVLIILGFCVGAIAMSIGVGGAIMIRPILSGFFNYSLKETIRISLFFVAFSSISGFFSLLDSGYINYEIGMIVGISSLVGVFIGLKALNYVDNKRLKQFVIVLEVSILVMVLNKLL